MTARISIFSVAVTLLAFTPLASAQDAPVRVLQLDRSARLEDLLPDEYHGQTISHAFQATPAGLAFLITPPGRGGPPQAVLQTSLAFTDPRLFPLAGRVHSGWLDRNAEGRVMLLRQTILKEPARVLDDLAEIDTPETLPIRVPSGAWTVDRRLVKGGAVGLAGNGEVVLWRDGQTEVLGTIEGAPAGPVLSCLLNEETVAFIGQNSARLHRVDLRTREIVTRNLDAPEIAARRNARRMVATGLACHQGRMLLFLNGYRPDGGAPLLLLNRDGDVLERWRCRLPQLEQFRDPEGYAAPSLVAVAGPRLLLLDVKGAVMSYPLF